MNRVVQEDSHGCGIACLAMATGHSYKDVRDWFEGKDFGSDGLSYFCMDAYLIEHGYAIARKYKHLPGKEIDRANWPPNPFAEVHVCGMRTCAKTNHYIIMLGDGSLIDPLWPDRKDLKFSDYDELIHVDGVWKVNGGNN